MQRCPAVYAVLLRAFVPVLPLVVASERMESQRAPPPLAPIRSTKAVVDDSDAVRFGWNLGVGYGAFIMGLTGASNADTRANASGSVASIEIGLTLNRRWRLGLAFVAPLSHSDIYAEFLLADVAYHPKGNGLWFKAYLGFVESLTGGGTCTLISPPPCTDYPPSIERGIAGGVGIGFDWRVSANGNLIVPFVSYVQQFRPSTFSGTAGISGSAALVQIGLAIGKHY